MERVDLSARTRRWARVVRLGCLVVAVGLAAVLATQAARLVSATRTTPGGSGSEKVLLVSATHPLPDDYRPPKLVRLVGTVPVSTRKVRVATRIAPALERMFAAANQAGVSGLYVISGYRSAAEQRKLWDKAKDKTYVQRPGRSEHQTGLAVDLGELGVTDEDFADGPAGRWLAENSWRYGFVLRYPLGKEEVTGISFEPWHFRYVGDRVAATCHRDGLTLEDYRSGGS